MNNGGELIELVTVLKKCSDLIDHLKYIDEDSKFSGAYAVLGLMVSSWVEIAASQGGYTKLVDLFKEIEHVLDKYVDSSVL